MQLVEKANRVTASAFLVALIAAVPYTIHTVLTDNGIQFRYPPRYANGHWKTMTFLAALRFDRIEALWLRFDRIEALWVIDVPIDGASFLTYVEAALVPSLAPGDVVIMDNLGSHKRPTVRAAIRKAAERTIEATWRRIGALPDQFTPNECTAYLVNAGYAST